MPKHYGMPALRQPEPRPQPDVQTWEFRIVTGAGHRIEVLDETGEVLCVVPLNLTQGRPCLSALTDAMMLASVSRRTTTRAPFLAAIPKPAAGARLGN